MLKYLITNIYMKLISIPINKPETQYQRKLD